MLFLHTLGELRLDDAGGETLSRRRKPLVLLAYLCRRAPRPVSRAELAALVWGEREETKARQSLRQALMELKRLLGEALDVGHDAVALSTGEVELDAAAFEQDADAGRDQAAAGRWQGDFLSAADDGAELSLTSWVDSERAALQRRLTIVLERLLQDAERRGNWGESVAIAKRWCDAAPFDERACRRLIGALRLGGQDVAATAAHAVFVARLREALDVAPSREFMELAASLDDAALSTSAESTAATSALQFVGRDDAFAVLTREWQRARQPRAGVALVEGRVGMGVSRTCEEFARWVTASDARALVLHADLRLAARAHGADAFTGARALFAALGDAPGLAGASPETLAILAGIAPSLLVRYPRIAARPREQSVAEVAGAVRDALSAISEEVAVLVVADGIAHTDAASRGLLLSLTTTRDLPVMFVFADASSAIDGEPGIAAMRDDAAIVRVTLAPLSLADVVTLIDGDDALAARLHAESGGIPALIAGQVDVLRSERLLVAGGDGAPVASPALAGRTLPTPAAARAIVRAVAGALDEDERIVFDAMAVLGAAHSPADAAAIARASPEVVHRAVDALLRSGHARRDDDGQVELVPPLFARAAYEIVPTLRRESLHAEAAALLRSRRTKWRDRAVRGARVEYHEQRAGGTIAPVAGRRRRRAIVVAAASMAAIALVALFVTRRGGSAVRPRTVAVLPFDVRGGADLAFLRAGMVDLLSTSLDGAAGLRTLAPRSVLAAEGTRDDRVLAPEDARQIATRLGASLFIIGGAVGAQGKLELNAALYDVRDVAAPIARAQAAGRAEDLFGLVDRLTAQLAVSQGASPRDRFTQLAALTTTSLDALKAYLEGETAYRGQQMPAALTAFKRAVAADTTFSLAWYRQASAASWMLLTDEERRAASEAVRTSGRLSDRDRALVEAFAAYSRGAADTAERLAGTIAETYGDVEAWVILGETLYHHNWKRGRSLSESRRAWEHVLAADPRHWPALQHLAEVAAVEGNRAEADSLLQRYERSVGPEHVFLPSHVFHRFAFGDQHERDAIVSQLSTDRGFWVIVSAWYVAMFARDVDGADRVTRLLVDPLRPPEQQGFGRVLLAHLALAGGKWREARAELAIAAVHTPAEAIEHETLMSLAPFLGESASAFDARRDSLPLLGADALGVQSGMRWPNTDAPLHNLIRGYLRGMIGARRRDNAAVSAALAQLDSLPDASGSIAIARGFRHAIRAELARARGATAEALAEIERGSRASPFVPAWTSAFISQAYERYERAELLFALGRDDEALRWYATFNENSPYDLIYLGPALYRQGQIHERHGRARAATEDYARFVALWRDCDEELRPLSEDAARRLRALVAAKPR